MNKITTLFDIKYPIIQAGMIWCSGWRLASAVSNAGGLGLIGSGSMNPDILLEHITKCKQATYKPFGVNIPLIFPFAEEFINIVIQEKIPIVFTSAGNPSKWSPLLKSHGIRVVHVIANVKFAKKCEEAGVDAVVAEGFEAGGHNGREETTSMVLIPMIREAISIPLIAAGGIATGRGMLAAFALGADAVQIGSRFVATPESSAHDSFKQKILQASEGDTKLMMKRLTPVRLLKNKFYDEIENLENQGASLEQITEHLGKGRARKGMFEGNEQDGELEIGQISGLIHQIKPAATILQEIMHEFHQAQQELKDLNF